MRKGAGLQGNQKLRQANEDGLTHTELPRVVSDKVNYVRNNGPTLIEAVA